MSNLPFIGIHIFGWMNVIIIIIKMISPLIAFQSDDDEVSFNLTVLFSSALGPVFKGSSSELCKGERIAILL